MIAEVGFEHRKIFYNQKRRSRDITKYNFYTLYDLAMLGITNLSKVPLRIFTFLASALLLISLFVASLISLTSSSIGTASVSALPRS